MKCILVDDEEVFRIQLSGLLEEIGGIEVVGEAVDVQSAVECIKLHPEAELLLMDVELPDGTCFDIIRQFDRLPKLLFITSHEEYALSAFEVNALDYIQKPITLDRLKLALDRLEEPLSSTDDKALPVLRGTDLLLLCCNRYRYFARVLEIVAIQSDENYTHIIRSNGSRFVMKKSLTAWEKQLPKSLFMRLGRQQLVNISALDRLELKQRGGLLWFKGVSDPIEIKHSGVKNLQTLSKLI